MVDKNEFENLIKLASQPVKSWGKTKNSEGSSSSTDKKFMESVVKWAVCAMFITETLGLACISGGCAGASQQLRATTSGIKIEYQVPREVLPVPNTPVRVVVEDERLDHEILGAGARSTFGSRVLGFFAFGLVSLALPGEPSFEQTDLAGIFQKAFEGRLRENGIPITKDSGTGGITLEISVRDFRLEFGWGNWVGEVGYVMKMKENSTPLCEDRINEKVKKFNVWGYGSGEAAISAAFVNAINRADLSNCLSKLKKS